MNKDALIALLSISCPVLTLIIPTINSFISNSYLLKTENDKFFNKIKQDTLDNLINSINSYVIEPTDKNKQICFLAISKLY